MVTNKKDERRASEMLGPSYPSAGYKDAALQQFDAMLSSGMFSDFQLDHKKGNPAADASNSNSQRGKFSEADVTQAIEMFFHSILDPAQTSAPIRKLVGRLQDPVLLSVKVNYDFLTDARHPARRLIKLVFIKGREFTKDASYEQNPNYIAILRVLNQLVEEYQSDDRLFLKAYFDIQQMP